MNNVSFPTACVLVSFLLLSTVAGCSREFDKEGAVARANNSNVLRLANLYFTFQMKHGWRGPPNEEVFKKFLNSFSPEKLRRIGIDPTSIDEVFISERDSEPFKIRYKVPGSMMGSPEPVPVIFESVGVGGKRMVGFLSMEEREVDEAEYDRLWGSKPQPRRRQQDRYSY